MSANIEKLEIYGQCIAVFDIRKRANSGIARKERQRNILMKKKKSPERLSAQGSINI